MILATASPQNVITAFLVQRSAVAAFGRGVIVNLGRQASTEMESKTVR